LRYGRQYFRQVSGNRRDFAVSPFPQGVIAFSRILDSHEILDIANAAVQDRFEGEVIVDSDLNKGDGTLQLLVSNVPQFTPPGFLRTAPQGTVLVQELDGSVTSGPARVLPVTLQPLEVQILRR